MTTDTTREREDFEAAEWADREAFEAWAEAKGLHVGTNVADIYVETSVWLAWEAWEASKQSALAQRQPAQGQSELRDDPDMDGTDFAHPAWWRGNDQGIEAVVRIANKALDGQDDLIGISGSSTLQALRVRLAALAHHGQDAGGEVGWEVWYSGGGWTAVSKDQAERRELQGYSVRRATAPQPPAASPSGEETKACRPKTSTEDAQASGSTTLTKMTDIERAYREGHADGRSGNTLDRNVDVAWALSAASDYAAPQAPAASSSQDAGERSWLEGCRNPVSCWRHRRCMHPGCDCKRAPDTAERERGIVERSIADLWQDLLEKDDRTSPEEYPDMALITFDEFEAAIRATAPTTAPVAGQRDGRWPAGCHSPSSCTRNRRCMYIGCRHEDEDITPILDALDAARLASPDAPPATPAEEER